MCYFRSKLQPIIVSFSPFRRIFSFNSQILADAAVMLPYMSEHEHGKISRLASILLLGFLLPRSTGNDFFVLQNISSRTRLTQLQAAGSQTSELTPSSNEAMGEYLIQIPLPERLASIPHKYCSDNFGELDSIVEEHVDAALCSFVKRALAPLLSTRPAHTQQVDLLHVIAMAIHPHPSEQPLRATVGELEDAESEIWSETQLLMSSLVPHNFHVNYRHRLLLVKLVAENLVLPSFNEEQAAIDAPLFEGALPHLRASLYAFGMAAMNLHDSHWSQCGMVSIAAQTGMHVVVREEWGRLLNRLMDDRTDYKCCHASSGRPCLSFMTESAASFCPHRARGRLLEVFLTRYSRARHFADSEFLQHALGSLTDAIEFKLDCWTRAEEEDIDEEKPDEGQNKAVAEQPNKMEKQEGTDETAGVEGESMGIDDSKGPLENTTADCERAKDKKRKVEDAHTTNEPPCVLASLLVAAKPLFYFSPAMAHHGGKDEDENEDSQHRDMLLSCSIQLLHHWNDDIALEASKLLVLFFSYGPENIVNDYAKALFSSVKVAVTNAVGCARKEASPVFAIDGLVATISRKSTALGEAILKLLLSLNVGRSLASKNLVARLMAVVVTASPLTATAHIKSIVELLQQNNTTQEVKSNLLAALLASRLAHFFDNNVDETKALVEKTIADEGSGWDLYLLGRQALVTGNFGAAEAIYDKLTLISTSESTFMWLLVLQRIASAEVFLLSNGAKGIPNGTTQLRSASSSLFSMPIFMGAIKADFTFQTRMLMLRLDFLDIVCAIRQLTSEMRLTNEGPKKFTRPSLHLKSTVKLLNVLGAKYLSVYRQYGLFICQQSRTAIRTLHALCRFVSSAARSTFIDELPEASADSFQLNAIQALTQPKGDASHPLVILMNRLDSQILKDMSGAVEPKIRAAAMLQVIDGVLKVPAPFPRAFLRTKPVPRAKYRLFLDSEIYDDHGEFDDDLDEEIEVSAGTLVTFYVSGLLPDSLVERANLPFYIILLWYTVTFQPSPSKESNDTEQEKQDDDNNAPSTTSESRSLASSYNLVTNGGYASPPPTAAVSLSPSGRFFTKVDCETIMNEAGLYTINTRLGCRDIRGGEWELPVDEAIQHSIPIRVVSSRS